MATVLKDHFENFLNKLASELDISEYLFREAESRYGAVGEWLSKDDSPFANLNPQVYVQGSFCLGTVVKPIGDGDEYDIDLVCELELKKTKVTQKQLKNIVGDRLKSNKDYKRMLDEECQHSWTISYSDAAKFHIDVLPAIPDEKSHIVLLEDRGVNRKFAEHAIAITDNKNVHYNILSDRWQRGNPIGFAEWFKNRMKVSYDSRRKILSEELNVSVDDVPKFKIKTPLQQSVQLLKWHRDNMFDYNDEDRPLSIIITTLAAMAYNNELLLADSLQHIIDNMSNYIENRSGVLWVQNPVDPDENFADKWKQFPQKKVSFFNWLNKLRADKSIAFEQNNISEAAKSMEKAFGFSEVKTALSKSTAFISGEKPIIITSLSRPGVEIKNPNKPWGCNEKR